MDKFLQGRIDEVALWARNHGFPDVCEWMLTKETKEKKAARRPRVAKFRTQSGRKVELYAVKVKELEKGE